MYLKSSEESPNALLTMVSTQSVGIESDSSTLQSDAFYQYADGSVIISFDEAADGQNVQHSIITFIKDKLVTINRTGICNSEYIVQVGQTHPCKYELPFGSLDLSIYGKDIKADLSSQGGSLSLAYTIYTNGDIISNNTIKLNIKLK